MALIILVLAGVSLAALLVLTRGGSRRAEGRTLATG
jgi:hypothetical protein